MTETPQKSVRADDLIDLHLHTDASDGRWTVEEAVDFMAGQGLNLIAISDHDSTAGIDRAVKRAHEKGNPVVLPAVEVSVHWKERLHHLLLYNINPGDRGLKDLLEEIRIQKVEAALQGVEALARMGYPLPNLDKVCGGKDPMPVSVVRAIQYEGYVNNRLEAVALGRSTGVSFKKSVELGRAVETAHAGGALALMAHPGRDYDVDAVMPDRLDQMRKSILIDGVEAYTGWHTAGQAALYTYYARERGMLVSGGSDSHAANEPRPQDTWPAGLFRPLLERCGVAVGK